MGDHNHLRIFRSWCSAVTQSAKLVSLAFVVRRGDVLFSKLSRWRRLSNLTELNFSSIVLLRRAYSMTSNLFFLLVIPLRPSGVVEAVTASLIRLEMLAMACSRAFWLTVYVFSACSAFSSSGRSSDNIWSTRMPMISYGSWKAQEVFIVVGLLVWRLCARRFVRIKRSMRVCWTSSQVVTSRSDKSYSRLLGKEICWRLSTDNEGSDIKFTLGWLAIQVEVPMWHVKSWMIVLLIRENILSSTFVKYTDNEIKPELQRIRKSEVNLTSCRSKCSLLRK